MLMSQVFAHKTWSHLHSYRRRLCREAVKRHKVLPGILGILQASHFLHFTCFKLCLWQQQRTFDSLL